MTDNGAAALASILHDIYGCRITCRGGRLADDRHPSHAEAYLDTARAVLDALDGVGWRLTARDKASPNEATIATLRADLHTQNDLIDSMQDALNDRIRESATLRAALDEADALIGELAEVVHQTDSLRSHADPNDKTGWNRHGIETCADSYCVDALAWRAALAAAKETP